MMTSFLSSWPQSPCQIHLGGLLDRISDAIDSTQCKKDIELWSQR